MILLMTVTAVINAQTEPGTVRLDSVVVHGNSSIGSLRISSDGSMLWDMQMMKSLPKILGDADPLHHLQQMPGISTNGEYDAGLHIAGFDNQHNRLSIDGTPLYGVSHLLGLFSIFNASHFKTMRFSKTIATAESPNMLGGEVDMLTHATRSDSITGEGAIGPISSQATVRIPTTQSSHLTLSLRASYMNLLYGSLLKNNEQSMRYSFYDANITWRNKMDESNSLVINLYAGNDNASMDMTDMQTDIEMQWGNFMTAAKWIHVSEYFTLENNTYFTRYHNNSRLVMPDLSVFLPASIAEMGNKLNISCNNWTAGIDASAYWIQPHMPEVRTSYEDLHRGKVTTSAYEISAYTGRNYAISGTLSAEGGLRGTLYHCGSSTWIHLSPSLSIKWKLSHNTDISLGWSLRHQYLHQTGLSTINTPMEYFVSSGMYNIKPQSAHGVSLMIRQSLLHNRYTITLEAYNRYVSEQTEYSGDIHSYLDADYSLSDLLHMGKGHNYGISLLLTKNKGRIRGWIGYTLSRAQRTYNTTYLNGTFPSSHDRTHELNAVVTASLGKRWDVGLTLVYATGTPFTAPKYYYLLGQRLMAEFAEHNANRLRPVFRTDVSINYHLRPTRYINDHGINLSIYNMTAHENDIFYYMHWNEEEFRYTRMRFVVRVMPSISYYMKF